MEVYVYKKCIPIITLLRLASSTTYILWALKFHQYIYLISKEFQSPYNTCGTASESQQCGNCCTYVIYTFMEDV